MSIFYNCNCFNLRTFTNFKYIKSQCDDLKWYIKGKSKIKIIPLKIQTIQNTLKKQVNWISQKLRNILNIAQEKVKD